MSSTTNKSSDDQASPKKPSEVFHSSDEQHKSIKFDKIGDAHDKETGKYVSDETVNRSLSHEKKATDIG